MNSIYLTSVIDFVHMGAYHGVLLGYVVKIIFRDVILMNSGCLLSEFGMETKPVLKTSLKHGALITPWRSDCFSSTLDTKGAIAMLLLPDTFCSSRFLLPSSFRHRTREVTPHSFRQT